MPLSTVITSETPGCSANSLSREAAVMPYPSSLRRGMNSLTSAPRRLSAETRIADAQTPSAS